MVFRRLRTRISVLVIALLVLVIAAFFLALSIASREQAMKTLHDDLRVTGDVLERILASKRKSLTNGAVLLAGDFAFKRAIATTDTATVQSAISNLKRRIDADVMILMDTDLQYIASDGYEGEQTRLADVVEEMVLEDTPTKIVVLSDQVRQKLRPYQLVTVPVLAPMPIAWLVVGFTLDAQFINEISGLTRTDVSLWLKDSQQVVDSTLSSDVLPQLTNLAANAFERQLSNTHLTAEAISPTEAIAGQSVLIELGNQQYLTLSLKVSESVSMILQRNLESALSGFYALRALFAWIAAIALATSILMSIWLAYTVTKPVAVLTKGAQAIESGDYHHRVQIRQRDELGRLAGMFNKMSKGLAEKDKVRNLLGKVVSPDVAKALIDEKSLSLGGEERMMTAMFTDLADFTRSAETMSPKALVGQLNEYLTDMTKIIHHHHGTVDKFIGDAIFAFWGAPLSNKDHAATAVRCAVELQEALTQLRAGWQAQNKVPWRMRIGIHSGEMIVGNMGSPDRLDYTAVGDAVNLAARLESANKYYGTNILVSSDVYEQLGDEYLVRRIDRVQVYGKEKAVELFEVIGKKRAMIDQTMSQVDCFEQAIDAFRAGDLSEAKKHFEHHQSLTSDIDRVTNIYLDRIRDLQNNVMPEDWAAVYRIGKV